MKFILHVESEDQIILAARAAKRMAAAPPEQTTIGLGYEDEFGPARYDASCRRTKSGITVWVRRTA